MSILTNHGAEPSPARAGRSVRAAACAVACAVAVVVAGCASKPSSASSDRSSDRSIKTAEYDVDANGMLIKR